MLLHKVFAGNILKIQFILGITDCLSILFERVLFVARDQHLDIDFLAIRALFIVHLDPLPQSAIPADHIMSTFTDCVIDDVFHADRALLELFAFHLVSWVHVLCTV